MINLNDPRPNIELNRIIAEWMGYYDFRQGKAGRHWFCRKPKEFLVSGTHKNTVLVEVPMYCTHLDPLYRAERRLSVEMGEMYCTLLEDEGRWNSSTPIGEKMATYCAGSRTRAEALVKVIEWFRQQAVTISVVAQT